MGNIAYNSFKKDMSDEVFTKALEEIVKDRFGDLIVVGTTKFPEYEEICSWVISPRQDLLSDDGWANQWEIFRKTKRKFGGKHPHTDFGSYLMTVVQDELAYRHNGRISDEGVPGTWTGTPNKYSSFEDYLKIMWKFSYKKYGQKFIAEQMKLSGLPKELQKL